MKVFRHWVLASCLCVGFVGYSAFVQAAQHVVGKETKNTAVAKQAPFAPALDAVLEKALAEKRIVGAVVKVAYNGKEVYSRAVGYANKAQGKPMQESTLFRLASVSKSYTSMAAAALIHQGVLGLDDPITKWLPWFTPKTALGDTPTITVRHLLSHTAGLNYLFFEAPEGPYHKAQVSDGLDASPMSLEENLKRIASAPLLFTPGEGWQYSLATDVLGAVIAQATGKPLPEAMHALVTGPLGLAHSGFVVENVENVAVPYTNGSPEPRPIGEGETLPFGPGGVVFSPARITNVAAFPSGGAGMAANAADVLHLLEAIRTGGGGITSPELLQDMVKNHIGTHRVAPGVDFGLGWSVLLDPKQAQLPQAAGTIAWSGVYGHSWFVDIDNGLTVVMLTNTTPEGIFGPLVEEVRDTVYKGLPGKQ